MDTEARWYWQHSEKLDLDDIIQSLLNTNGSDVRNAFTTFPVEGSVQSLNIILLHEDVTLSIL